jgi:acyl CoA:acetate/3-ketoacid CoA transferase beta subunit
VTAEGLVLRERAPGVSAAEVAQATGAPLTWNGSVPEIKI